MAVPLEAAGRLTRRAVPSGARATIGSVPRWDERPLVGRSGELAALEAAVEREPGDDPRPAVVITGLRNPCGQIDNFRSGLLGEVAYRDEGGTFVRKAGVMGVVLRGGPVRPGDPVTVELPPLPHEPLDRV